MMKNVLAGFTIWLVFVKLMSRRYADVSWIDALFLFAPLVIVPLGLDLRASLEKGITASEVERIACAVQLPAAFSALMSFLFAPGPLAGTLAAVWFAFCVILGFAGLGRLFHGGLRELDRACPAIAFLSLPVGGVWLIASRLGLRPLDFHEPIVLLTAVHFHYAGFASALLVRPVARTLAPPDSRSIGARAFRIIAWGVLAGPAVLAGAFLLGPQWKLIAASWLAASQVGLAIAFFATLRRVEGVGSRLLIGLAATSVVFSMVYATIWAIGEYPLQPFVGIDEMARLHGTVNAFGFALCGLGGWTLSAGASSATHVERAQG